MRSPLRSSRIVAASFLLLVSTVSCYSYRAVPLSETRLLGPQTSHIEIQLKDGRRLMLTQPTVQGDTLYGVDEWENSTATNMDDITLTRVRHFSGVKTAGATILTSAGILGGAFLIALFSWQDKD